MKNLAGVITCDTDIEQELRLARVPVVHALAHRHEVPYTKSGKLGDFTFIRNWYYWSVEGRVPIEIAKEIYQDPACVKDVRVAGHCGAPEPKEGKYGADLIDVATGLHIVEDEEMDKFPELFKEQTPAELGLIRASEVEKAGRKGEYFVTLYHIDTQAGLDAFVGYLKKHKLVPS